jgi:hypothetical protein
MPRTNNTIRSMDSIKWRPIVGVFYLRILHPWADLCQAVNAAGIAFEVR